ncbi:hypothetical protein CVV43_02390 [Candidatus Saccharibacteria bacterium HGW-Saccharibacteria-1]|jgi:hypothetical protein|nr:MAG: hypothetical protein CVV43_02390 [Candidatus Saccharibacteria bacterium HGW-Saccharibacteria-1]
MEFEMDNIISFIMKVTYFGLMVALFAAITLFSAPFLGIFSPMAAAVVLLIAIYPLTELFILATEAILNFIYNGWN